MKWTISMIMGLGVSLLINTIDKKSGLNYLQKIKENKPKKYYKIIYICFTLILFLSRDYILGIIGISDDDIIRIIITGVLIGICIIILEIND